MSSRVRKSESARDMKEETLPPGDIRERDPWPGKERPSSFRGGNPSKWSDLEASNALKSDDCSRRPSWETPPGDSNIKRAEDINDVRHKMLADPTNDGWGQHHSRPSDDSWSQPHSVRSSVRNQSRDGGGSRSRSRSRSRGKTRGMGRSRSRSRSRSWDRGGAGGRGRSRSPFYDDRRESYDSIDRASGTRLSSRVCRDFATGNCRRGSQCRFLHQENLNLRGGNRSDNDVTERSSSRPGYGGASRYGNDRTSADRPHDKVSDGSRRYNGKDDPDVTERSSSRSEYGGASRYGDNRTSADRIHDKVSDGPRKYNGEDEPVRDNIKDTFCCKEFLKGRCHWGASCRYPHHVASGDNYNRGNRNASYNHDSKGPANRSGKVPCKYFLIGKCHREDCRFSHDAPTSEGSDGRSRDDRLGHKADEKKKTWNGPTWDEVAPGLTNIEKSTGRRDSSFQNLNYHDSAAYEKHSAEKKNSWNGPTWDEINASDLSDIAKSAGRRDSSVRNLNSHDSATNEKGTNDKNKSWNAPAWDEVSAPDFGRGNSSARNLNSCDTVGTGKHTDKNKSWNGLTWDETSGPGLSDATKSIEWGDRSVGNFNSHDSVAIETQSGARGGHSWENNSRPRDGPVWNDKTVDRNEYLPPYHRGASNDAYMGTNEFRGMKKLDGNEEPRLVFDCSRSQTLDGPIPSHERNIMLDLSGCELATTILQAQVSENSYRHGGDHPTTFDDSNVLDVDMVSEDTTYPVLTAKQVGYQSPSNLGGTEQSRNTVSLNPLNGPNVDLSGSVHDKYPPMTRQIQTRIHQNEAGEAQEVLERGVPQVMSEMSETVVSSKQVAQITDLPAILTQISQSGQLPQIFAALKSSNAMGLVHSTPTSTSVVLPVNPTVVQPNMDMKSKVQYDPAMEIIKPGTNNEPLGVLSSSTGKENEVPSEHLSLLSTSAPSSTKLHASGVSGEEYQKSPKSKQQGPGVNREVNDNNIAEKCKQEQENIQAGNSDARANVEEGNISNDEKAMRLFKIALVEFVKEILKPTWKEGRMSREVHKTIVKKAVDKVTSTLQGIQIPRTPEKIEQYMAFSKSKITKLVEAYVERFSKPADA